MQHANKFVLTKKVQEIISWYSYETAGVKEKLVRLLNSGKLAGTGRLVILPVDQGSEHGPDASFLQNPLAFDPRYHYEIAVEAGLSAYAAPLGMLEAAIRDEDLGLMPMILKLNGGNLLHSGSIVGEYDQAYTASVDDALRLGCIGVGLTIYPGSTRDYEMIEEAREVVKEARSKGLLTVIWSYPRGNKLKKEEETALDVISYSAHIAALLGAHVIKVKPPTDVITDRLKPLLKSGDEESNFRHIVRSCFAGKRLIVFSGGVTKSDAEVLREIKAIHSAGGTGSIIGRNCFQRKREDALNLLAQIMDVYKK